MITDNANDPEEDEEKKEKENWLSTLLQQPTDRRDKQVTGAASKVTHWILKDQTEPENKNTRD